MACSAVPKIVIVVNDSHWLCVTCELSQKRAVSLDEHLALNHPLPPVPPPPSIHAANRQALSDGEEFEIVGIDLSTPGRPLKTVTQKPPTKARQWLDKPHFCSSDDDDGDDGDADDGNKHDDYKNDRDLFVQSKSRISKSVPSKAVTRSKRATEKTQPQPSSEKPVRLRVSLTVPKEEPVDELEAECTAAKQQEQEQELSEFEPSTEPEPDDDDDGEDYKPSTKLRRGKPPGKHSSHSVRSKHKNKKTLPEPSAVEEIKTPRKRGRPPKPKPPPEEVDLPPKRPYRKRVPDPSELLLKLRNVGRKPNTRKKLQKSEKEALKARYVKFVSKAVNDPEMKTDADDDDDSSSSFKEGADQTTTTTTQDSLSSEGTSVSQQQDIPSDSHKGEKICCTTCLHVFKSHRLLKEHASKVSGEDVFQCQACEMKFHGLMDLNLHVFCDHEDDIQPACFLCKGEDFSSMEGLERHLNTQHRGQGDLKLTDTRFHDCRLCRMELNMDFQLIKNHYYRRHKAYVCPDCFGRETELLYYTDTALYGEHKHMHARSPAECRICRQVFPTAREMKAHMWTHAQDDTQDGTGGQCGKCQKWLPNAGALLMHEKVHKNEAIRKNYALEASIGFPCMRCEHIFSSKSNLKKHSCKADPEHTFHFHCEYCAHGCNTKEQLRDHIATHHLGIKRYACKHCHQRFVCAPTLRRHVRRVHTKEKPYQCHLCHERFFERNLMLRHVSKHTGIASFMCEFCGKGFHTKFDLKKHVENHNESRDHVCSNCGLDYKRSYHLKRHLEKGCKKKFPRNKREDEDDDNPQSEASVAGPVSQEDADEMVYLDLAREVNAEDGDDDNGLDSYQDDSLGPDFA